MKRILLSLAMIVSVIAMQAKTLIVYYSYTNNVHSIVNALTKQIDADVVRIEPAEKGLDYAANNYAIGSAQIAAIRNNPTDPASYPAIDPVNVNLADYDCIIIGAPLWWSNMAHFQKYKQGTLHMVDSLRLDDVTPLNLMNVIHNTIEPNQTSPQLQGGK